MLLKYKKKKQKKILLKLVILTIGLVIYILLGNFAKESKKLYFQAQQSLEKEDFDESLRLLMILDNKYSWSSYSKKAIKKQKEVRRKILASYFKKARLFNTKGNFAIAAGFYNLTKEYLQKNPSLKSCYKEIIQENWYIYNKKIEQMLQNKEFNKAISLLENLKNNPLLGQADISNIDNAIQKVKSKLLSYYKSKLLNYIKNKEFSKAINLLQNLKKSSLLGQADISNIDNTIQTVKKTLLIYYKSKLLDYIKNKEFSKGTDLLKNLKRKSLFTQRQFSKVNKKIKKIRKLYYNNAFSKAKNLNKGIYKNLELAKEKWYKITIAKNRRLKIFLVSTKKGNFELKLYNEKRKVLKSSYNIRNKAELILEKVESGNYYLKIRGSKNNYKIKVDIFGSSWTVIMANDLGLPISSIKQMVYEYGGKKYLDMSCSTWGNLSYNEQVRYASAYQKAYAKHVNKPVKKTFYKSGTNFEMRLIPPGRFWMGSPDGEKDRYSDESPRHRVLISKGFWLQKTEITQGQWRSVVGESPWSGKGYAKDNSVHAASYISWDDIKNKLLPKLGDNFDFPTEAQWEYACRSGVTGRFYWGDDNGYSEIGDYAWYVKNAWDIGERYAHAVAQKKPNAWGLYDMSGNVYEWCKDRYKNRYSGNEQVDPVCTSGSSSRVSRGGSWNNSARNCRSAYRCSYSPDYRWSALGGRLQVIAGF